MEGMMKKFNSEQGAKEFVAKSGKAHVVIINHKRAKVDTDGQVEYLSEDKETLLIKKSRKDKKRSSIPEDTENRQQNG